MPIVIHDKKLQDRSLDTPAQAVEVARRGVKTWLEGLSEFGPIQSHSVSQVVYTEPSQGEGEEGRTIFCVLTTAHAVTSS